MSVLVEACCASVEDVLVAEQAGCDRVELCSAMTLGGLTPTVGMVRAIKAKSNIPIMAMNRPRSGGFCYTDAEFEMMDSLIGMRIRLFCSLPNGCVFLSHY